MALLFTVDPIGKPWHNSNSVQPMGNMVKLAFNYHQRQNKKTFGFEWWGYKVQGAVNVLWELNPDIPVEQAILDDPYGPHMYIMLDGTSMFSSTFSPRTIDRMLVEVNEVPAN